MLSNVLCFEGGACETCSDKGIVFSCNEDGDDDVQRCDECAVFASDYEAKLKAKELSK